MATESDVDISGAHPYWAYPFSDVAVVHNGQLTNYFQWKRRLERSGHRFQSECDSEIIAVYLAEKMSEGATLEDAMRESLEELDGVFTYICVTEGRARRRQGRDGGEAARALRSGRPRRARVGGDRDPRHHRPRDRHLRPVRRGGAGMAALPASTRSATTRAASPSRTPRCRRSRRSTAPRPSSTPTTSRRGRSTSSCAGCSTSRASRTSPSATRARSTRSASASSRAAGSRSTAASATSAAGSSTGPRCTSRAASAGRPART